MAGECTRRAWCFPPRQRAARRQPPSWRKHKGRGISMRTGQANRRASKPFAVALLLFLLAETQCAAEDHFDYKFEYYAEEKDRIQVRTHTGLFEQSLDSWLALRGSVVYDGISGATPRGGPPPAGSKQVALANIDDARYAGALEADFRFG